MTVYEDQAVSNSKVKLKWGEQYVSESLNKSMAKGFTGIHHGFRITPDGGAVVKLKNSSRLSNSMAVVPYHSQNMSFLFRDSSEPSWDMRNTQSGNLEGERVYFFIHIDYETEKTTEAQYRLASKDELDQPWTKSATCLGSVRVPSSGDIDKGDIELYTADMAGLSDGKVGLWTPLNTNMYFSSGLAGYNILEEEEGQVVAFPYESTMPDYENSSRDSIAILGTHDDEAGEENHSSIQVDISKLDPNDEVLVKCKISPLEGDYGYFMAPPISGNPELKIRLYRRNQEFNPLEQNDVTQTLVSEVSLPVTDVNKFSSHGVIFDIPEIQDSIGMMVSIDVILPDTGVDRGLFAIDNFEVLCRQQNNKPNLTTPKRVGTESIDVGRTGTGFGRGSTINRTYNQETGYVGLTFWDEDNPVQLTEPNYNEVSRSIARTINESRSIYKGLDPIVGDMVINGGEVIDNGDGTVSVSEVTIRSTSRQNDIPFGVSDRYAVVDGVPSLEIEDNDTTIIHARHDGIEASTGFYNGPAIAFVEKEAGQITEIADIRDLFSDIEKELPISVGSGRRFENLNSALKFIENHSDYRNKVILSDDTHVIDKAAYVPSNTTITSDGDALIRRVDAGDDESILIAGADDGTTITIENVRFRFQSSIGIPGQTIKVAGSSGGHVDIKNCTMHPSDSPKHALLVDEVTTHINIINSKLDSQDATIESSAFLDGGGAGKISIDNCEIYSETLALNVSAEKLSISECNVITSGGGISDKPINTHIKSSYIETTNTSVEMSEHPISIIDSEIKSDNTCILSSESTLRDYYQIKNSHFDGNGTIIKLSGKATGNTTQKCEFSNCVVTGGSLSDPGISTFIGGASKIENSNFQCTLEVINDFGPEDKIKVDGCKINDTDNDSANTLFAGTLNVSDCTIETDGVTVRSGNTIETDHININGSTFLTSTTDQAVQLTNNNGLDVFTVFEGCTFKNYQEFSGVGISIDDPIEQVNVSNCNFDSFNDNQCVVSNSAGIRAVCLTGLIVLQEGSGSGHNLGGAENVSTSSVLVYSNA